MKLSPSGRRVDAMPAHPDCQSMSRSLRRTPSNPGAQSRMSFSMVLFIGGHLQVCVNGVSTDPRVDVLLDVRDARRERYYLPALSPDLSIIPSCGDQRPVAAQGGSPRDEGTKAVLAGQTQDPRRFYSAATDRKDRLPGGMGGSRLFVAGTWLAVGGKSFASHADTGPQRRWSPSKKTVFRPRPRPQSRRATSLSRSDRDLTLPPVRLQPIVLTFGDEF